jgi:serine protease DegS
LSAASFSDRVIEPGAPALLCGNPYGIGKSVTIGTIAATGRTVHLERDVPMEDLMQISAPAFPGDGGSLVADVRGSIAGIIIAGAGPGPSGAMVPFAVPADVAEFVARGLMADGKVRRGWIGLEVVEPSKATLSQLAIEGGAVVEVARPDGPSHGKIKQHDVLTRLNGVAVKDLHSLRMAVWKLEEGKSVVLEVIRQTEKLEVTLTVGRQP